jgi:vacuolar-type H+-ATPase subunit I/STV1
MLKGKMARVLMTAAMAVAGVMTLAAAGWCTDPIAPVSLAALLGTVQTDATSNILLVASVGIGVFLVALGIKFGVRIVRKWGNPA